MTTKRLSNTHVERQRLPAGKANTIIWDALLPGFGMRVNQGKKTGKRVKQGRKSWLIQTRMPDPSTKHGRQISYVFANVAEMTDIAEAREEAGKLLRMVRSGTHPKEAKRAEQEAKQEAKRAAEAESRKLAYTFRAMTAEYLASPIRRDGKPHSAGYRRANRWLLDAVLQRAPFADKPVDQITRKMLIDYRDAIPVGAKGAINRANQLRAINRMFDWATEREKLDGNVFVAGGRKFAVIARSAVRDRALGFRMVGDDQKFDPAEIVAFWHAAGELGPPFAPVLKLLLLTGQRLREVAEMRWTELSPDRTTWAIPGERTKNGKGHTVPLSKLAREILAEMPQLGNSEFVFTTLESRPVSGFSYAKRRIDRLLPDLPEWNIHDLRRTAATAMEMIGIDLRVIEACLNHKSGTKRGLIKTYQTFRFSDRKAPALEKYSEFLEGLIAGEDADALIARAA